MRLLGTFGGFPAGPQTVALSAECEDLAVMNEAIDDLRCRHLVGKYLGPFFEWQVGCEYDATSLIPL